MTRSSRLFHLNYTIYSTWVSPRLVYCWFAAVPLELSWLPLVSWAVTPPCGRLLWRHWALDCAHSMTVRSSLTMDPPCSTHRTLMLSMHQIVSIRHMVYPLMSAVSPLRHLLTLWLITMLLVAALLVAAPQSTRDLWNRLPWSRFWFYICYFPRPPEWITIALKWIGTELNWP